MMTYNLEGMVGRVLLRGTSAVANLCAALFSDSRSHRGGDVIIWCEHACWCVGGAEFPSCSLCLMHPSAPYRIFRQLTRPAPPYVSRPEIHLTSTPAR